MKKKTGFVLGIATVCLLGLGTQVKAASENGTHVTVHHYSDWHETHHQQMQEQQTRNSYENESISVNSVSSANTEATVTEGVYSCPQGHAWCDGNHQDRSSVQSQTHHNEECSQNNNHQNGGRHHGSHH